MRHSTYQAMLPFYMQQRPLNPLCYSNVEWMNAWFARKDALDKRVKDLMDAGRYDWATATLKANPVVPITEESVKLPVPPVVEAEDPMLTFVGEF